MHTYDAHGLPYFISSSGVMQFRKAYYTAVSYAPYILLQIYTITILATFRVTIFQLFHPGPSLNISHAFQSDSTGRVVVFSEHCSQLRRVIFKTNSETVDCKCLILTLEKRLKNVSIDKMVGA